MAGSVINLSLTGFLASDPVVVDTNLIVELLIVSFPGAPAPSPQATVNAQRTSQFFQWLVARNGTGLVTPTTFNELIHFAIKTMYEDARRRLGPLGRRSYGRPITSWLDLYKADRAILQSFLPFLGQLKQLLATNGLLFIGPDDLGPIASGRSYGEELVHLVGTYGLDSNDALILMEAQRYGVTDIVTLDADLQRAQADFNIYTWL